MRKIVCLLTFCLSISLNLQAQLINLVNDLGINHEDSSAVVEQIIFKVNDLQEGIKDLAGRGNASHSVKVALKNRLLKLFIGEGKSYPYPDADNQYKMHSAVTMGYIDSKYRKNHKTLPMTDYLNKLIQRSEDPYYKYKKIVIEAADAVRVDNLTPVGDGRYMATAHILQRFAGYRNENLMIYEDYTAKTITIYITRVEIPDPTGIKYYWDIQLGDIDSDDIW